MGWQAGALQLLGRQEGPVQFLGGKAGAVQFMGGKEVCAVHGGRRGGGAAHDDGVAQDQEELWRGRGCIGRGGESAPGRPVQRLGRQEEEEEPQPTEVARASQGSEAEQGSFFGLGREEIKEGRLEKGLK